MLLYDGDNLIKKGVRDSCSSVEDDDVYERRADSVLDFPSDSYLLLNSILVDISRLFSCLASHCLLTTLITDYCLNWDVNNFVLRKTFYSRQGLKNTCYSPICTDHKWILQHRALI